MIHKHASFILAGAILVAILAKMTLYNVNVANAQLAHIPGMSTKTITSGLGNMSTTISKAVNKTLNATGGGIIPQAK